MQVHDDGVGSDGNAHADAVHTTPSHDKRLITLAPGFFKVKISSVNDCRLHLPMTYPVKWQMRVDDVCLVRDFVDLIVQCFTMFYACSHLVNADILL